MTCCRWRCSRTKFECRSSCHFSSFTLSSLMWLIQFDLIVFDFQSLALEKWQRMENVFLVSLHLEIKLRTTTESLNYFSLFLPFFFSLSLFRTAPNQKKKWFKNWWNGKIVLRVFTTKNSIKKQSLFVFFFLLRKLIFSNGSLLTIHFISDRYLNNTKLMSLSAIRLYSFKPLWNNSTWTRARIHWQHRNCEFFV